MIKYSDGVVDIYRNKTKEPYIIFETKRWGMGLEKPLLQLKSYLAIHYIHNMELLQMVN